MENRHYPLCTCSKFIKLANVLLYIGSSTEGRRSEYVITVPRKRLPSAFWIVGVYELQKRLSIHRMMGCILVCSPKATTASSSRAVASSASSLQILSRGGGGEGCAVRKLVFASCFASLLKLFQAAQAWLMCYCFGFPWMAGVEWIWSAVELLNVAYRHLGMCVLGRASLTYGSLGYLRGQPTSTDPLCTV
jgi:hypothetical protein